MKDREGKRGRRGTEEGEAFEEVKSEGKGGDCQLLGVGGLTNSSSDIP